MTIEIIIRSPRRWEGWLGLTLDPAAPVLEDDQPHPWDREFAIEGYPSSDWNVQTHRAMLVMQSDDTRYRASFQLVELADDTKAETLVYVRTIDALGPQAIEFGTDDLIPAGKRVKEGNRVVVRLEPR